MIEQQRRFRKRLPFVLGSVRMEGRPSLFRCDIFVLESSFSVRTSAPVIELGSEESESIDSLHDSYCFLDGGSVGRLHMRCQMLFFLVLALAVDANDIQEPPWFPIIFKRGES
jgi:hypothetical protein